jgi:hypothetical protein
MEGGATAPRWREGETLHSDYDTYCVKSAIQPLI